MENLNNHNHTLLLRLMMGGAVVVVHSVGDGGVGAHIRSVSIHPPAALFIVGLDSRDV